jgi:1,4-dihydroxy-2-naphthoate octaprenyltransferase
MFRIFDKDTLRLLRIPFSFFLMPVFFLAVSQSSDNWTIGKTVNALIIFIILHVFIYPASNGYNSYMDQDEGSIGGLKTPPKATRNLFQASIIFDVVGLLLSLYIGVSFFIGILIYMVVSRAYSYKGIRLKRFPIVGFASVVIFQGAVTFLNVYIGVNQVTVGFVIGTNLIYPMIASSLMIGGVYPLTQIYQHEQDKLSGDITISYILGYKGTFLFSVIMFLGAGALLFTYFSFRDFMIFQLFLSPVAYFFVKWMLKVWKDTSEANFENTMQMNMIASICMNSCFITLFILHGF